MRNWLLLVLFLVIAPPVGAVDVEVRHLRGTRNGPLEQLASEGGKLVVKAGGEAIPCESVKSIHFIGANVLAPGPDHVAYFFWNGDHLVGAPRKASEQDVEFFVPATGKIVAISFDALRAVSAKASPEMLPAFREAHLGKEPTTDVLLRKSGTNLSGTIGAIEPTGVRMSEEDLGDATFGWSDILGVLIAPLEPVTPLPADQLLARVTLLDGGILTGRLEALKGADLQLDLPHLGRFAVPVISVQRIDFLNGRFEYLSDLQPSEVVERGVLLSLVFPYQRDREVVEKGPLKLRTKDGEGKVAEQEFAKGLGVHAYCELAYRLDKRYRTFHARIGLDEAVRRLATADDPAVPAVVFRVLVDGKVKGEEVMTAPDAARSLEVDVSGASEIRLVVDVGPDSFEVLARADWADAHLIRK